MVVIPSARLCLAHPVSISPAVASTSKAAKDCSKQNLSLFLGEETVNSMDWTFVNHLVSTVMRLSAKTRWSFSPVQPIISDLSNA